MTSGANGFDLKHKSRALTEGPSRAPARAQLKGIGYDRVTSVEIFRPEYWERDPLELAQDAYDATRKVLAAAGL